MMHEDSPKMSVAQGLAASSSQPKSEIVFERAVEYEISTEPKSTESIELEIKIPYVDPTNETKLELIYNRIGLY
ncbi:jg118 [Pararge aegeria aegeria]|uniref:Jg118 protein n=1 Tax=Pararge aegeria aegeria TaxID=348720 RepID=A0A8S4QW33_9NEOP|nr:jg118 [Pararge aegeria aegeria]